MIRYPPTALDALKLQDLDLLRQLCFVDGRWIEAKGGARIAVTDPASGMTVAQVPNLGPDEVRGAVTAAHRAQPAWRSTTAKQRSALLRRLFDLMIAHQEDLARIITLEQGKPLAEARAEIGYAASFVEWFSEEAKRVYGDLIPTPVAGRRLLVQKEPIGVFAAITPWNFPMAMITRKAAPGWAAGCAGVFRPDSRTPLSALALAVLTERAGFPPGVYNVVTGPAAAVGEEFCANPLVRKLSFTGSTQVGALLLSQCARTIKKTSMELGGNAPFIVFDDADLDAAVAGAIAAKYRNSGQTCVCANRFLVQDGVYDAFTRMLGTAVAALRVGPGGEAGVDQGPLISSAALARVTTLVEDAVACGGRIVTGGRPHARGGNFYEPTVLADVPASARICHEETFGPVAPVTRFATETDAIAMANDTEFGLAAYLYSRDLSRVMRIAEALEAGMVGVNEGMISTEVAPFGGVKSSGLGREGSRYGIEEYLEMKYVCLGGLES